RELSDLFAVAAEDGDEHRSRIAGTFDEAEVGAIRLRLGDLLEREDRRLGEIRGASDERSERNGRDVLTECAIRGRVERATRGEGGDVGERIECVRYGRCAGQLSEWPQFECADLTFEGARAEPGAEDVVESDGLAGIDVDRRLLGILRAGVATWC